MAVVINSDDPSYQVYIDNPTGHKITTIVPLSQHYSKCSARRGFMCNCKIMEAAQYAVDEAKVRVAEWYATKAPKPQQGDK